MSISIAPVAFGLITFGTVMGVTGRVPSTPMDAIVTIADAAPDWRQAKPEMTKPEATNTELAPLSDRLAQIRRTLFLMESTERLARLHERHMTGTPRLLIQATTNMIASPHNR